MPIEEFEIIIKKNGEIFIDFKDLSPQRVRDLRQMLSETIGPTKELVQSNEEGDLPPTSVKIKEEKDKIQIKNS